MAFPAGVQTVTLTGHQALADGAGQPVPIRIRPVPTRVVGAEWGVVVDDTPVVVTPDAAGQWSRTLVATDAAGFSPTGWTYRVETGADAFHISLPHALGEVDLAELVPVAADDGEYVLVPGPPGPPGPPGDPATNLVQSVNGKQGVVVLVAGDVGAEAAGSIAEALAAHLAAVDPHGDRAYADGKFATIAVVSSLGGSVTQLDGFVQDCLSRVAAIEQGTAFLSGLNVNGSAQVANGNLTVTNFVKGYRYRTDGGALDWEGTGSDLIISVWSGNGFNGDQHSYMRLSSDAQNIQVAGKVEFVDALYGATRHVLDGTANRVGFFGAAPAARPEVAGSWSDGTAGESLAAALAELGLIDNQTSS
jgi:hypothetical protein